MGLQVTLAVSRGERDWVKGGSHSVRPGPVRARKSDSCLAVQLLAGAVLTHAPGEREGRQVCLVWGVYVMSTTVGTAPAAGPVLGLKPDGRTLV